MCNSTLTKEMYLHKKKLLLSLIFFCLLIFIFFFVTYFLKKISFSGEVNKQKQINHVFVIVEENHNWTTIMNNPDAPFINQVLLRKGSYASNYHNVATTEDELHPSELNYIYMQSGTASFPDYTFTTDNVPSADNSTASHDFLTHLLELKGYTWKSYQEDITGQNCPIDPVENYSPKHNPFLFFQDVSGNPPDSSNPYCKEHNKSLHELESDLKDNTVPNYVFITPNLQNNMHDGTVAQADTWLSQVVSKITASKVFQNSVLFITWDEGSENDNTNNPIGMIILSPFAKKGYTNTIEYSHASLLKTTEEIFALRPLLGDAANPQVKDLFDFLK